MWCLLLLYIPIVLFTAAIFNNEKAISGTAVIWGIFVIISGLLVSFSRCPKCNKYFHMKIYWQNPFAMKCLHCGLKLTFYKSGA
jgi:hypothetical protein